MTSIMSGPRELRQTVTPVGTVVQLSRCPVKSMGAEPLTAARVNFQGIMGDRRFAFIQGRDQSHFPWLTAREVPQMLLYQAALTDPNNPDKCGAIVTTPGGQHLDLFSAELVEELRAQAPPRLRDQPIYAVHLKSAHDGEAISLITTYAVDRLAERAGMVVDVRRFRENLVIDTTGSPQPDEQTWVGRQVRIGDGPDAPLFPITRGDPRCMIPNLDPDTAEQDPCILRTIAQQQDNLMGVYAAVAQAGTLRLGATVYLIAPEAD